MASKRKYPPKICSNPACQDRFVPHDKRQLYCSDQCRINFNNDKKNEAYEELKYQQKLKHGDQMLAELYDHQIMPRRIINAKLLNLLKVDLNIGILDTYIESHLIIRWYINYGLIRLYGRKEEFVIYTREEFKKFISRNLQP